MTDKISEKRDTFRELSPKVLFWLESLLYAFLYYLSVKFSLLLLIPSSQVCPLWLPSGLCLAVLFLRGWTFLPALILASIYMDYQFFTSQAVYQSGQLSSPALLFLTPTMSTVRFLHSFIACYLLKHYVDSEAPFQTVERVVLFALFMLLNDVITGFLGVVLHSIFGISSWQTFASAWLNWTLGDYISDLTVVPTLVIMYDFIACKHRPDFSRGVPFGLILILCLYLVFFNLHTNQLPLSWILYGLLMWSAFLFGQTGAVITGALVSLLALYATAHNLGPFVLSPQANVLYQVQAFVGLYMISSLLFGAMLREKEIILQALQKASLEARAASQAKSEFLANMSHELRTPLNAVLGFTKLLEREIKTPKHLSYLQAIQTSGKSLLTLINDILDLSKLEAGKLEIHYEPVELNHLLHEIEQIFSAQIEDKQLDFKIYFDENTPQTVILDEIRLRQILINLVGNAIKFTHQGSIQLFIYCATNLQDDSKIDLHIDIQDTGIGIPIDSQTSIFDAFQQQSGQDSRKYGGTGLGLKITKNLLERMNGSLSLESQLGQGSCFKILLNEVSVSVSSLTKRIHNVTPLHLQFLPQKLLVVDDLETNRKLIRDMFQQQSLEIFEAENGVEAIRLAKTYQPDLILMDIRMPTMDGYEAAEQLKQSKQTSQIPIIALSATVHTAPLNSSENSVFECFLKKPVDEVDLLNVLARFLKYKVLQSIPFNTEDELMDSNMEPHLTFDLKHLDQECFKHLLLQLENEFVPMAQNLRTHRNLTQTREFGEYLIEIAMKNNFSDLTHYAQKILNYVDSFEFEKLDQSLANYPIFIDALKAQLIQTDKG